MPAARLKITGGSLRGRILRSSKRSTIRSTSAKLRAAIFNVLGPVEGLAVADLYCGSGALGIEALSRGAERVEAVDRALPARELVAVNIAQLAPELRARHAFYLARVESYLANRDPLRRVDLVLMDPPYGQGADLETMLQAIAQADLLAPGGRLVCEHSSRSEFADTGLGLDLLRSYRYGDSAFSLLQKSGQ